MSSNPPTRQAIPFDYAAYDAALDSVRRMIASGRALGMDMHDLEERLAGAQKALAEFDAAFIRTI
jgi:hypothetical protein